MQAKMIMNIVASVQSGRVTVPLWDQSASFANNQTFLLAFITKLIGEAFKNLTAYVW